LAIVSRCIVLSTLLQKQAPANCIATKTNAVYKYLKAFPSFLLREKPLDKPVDTPRHSRVHTTETRQARKTTNKTNLHQGINIDSVNEQVENIK